MNTPTEAPRVVANAVGTARRAVRGVAWATARGMHYETDPSAALLEGQRRAGSGRLGEATLPGPVRGLN